MIEQQERIRITAGESDVLVALEGGLTELVFGAELPMGGLAYLRRSDVPEEFVITFEFDRSHSSGTHRTVLRRLDVHVRNVSIRLREDGYVIDADLSGWVGYTDACADALPRQRDASGQ